MKDYILSLIQRSFEVDIDKAECLYGELLQCTKRKNLVRTNIIKFVELILMLFTINTNR